MNKVLLLGNVGADAEVKAFDNGNEIVQFKLATSERYKDKQGEWKELTEWHTIKVTRPGLVDFCKKHVKKGMRLVVEGKIKTAKWIDKNRQNNYFTVIECSGLNVERWAKESDSKEVESNEESGLPF